MIYDSIVNNKQKQFALLIDPNNYSENTLIKTVQKANISNVNYILVGGSLISELSVVERTINVIKNISNIPVLLFPGSLLQISNSADGILLLSLISGRNPDLLIGNHVIAAPVLKNTKLEILPVGYILIDNGTTTSVEYISNTKPIPSNKPELIAATAMAGEMIGNKLIYLEAGSGAEKPVPVEVIKKVKESISIPLIVGGGIKKLKQLNEIYEAGADIIVIGNAIEKDDSILNVI